MGLFIPKEVKMQASMKVPPKRKGNPQTSERGEGGISRLNESPSEKEGKWCTEGSSSKEARRLNESPSEKEGKCPLPRRQAPE